MALAYTKHWLILFSVVKAQVACLMDYNQTGVFMEWQQVSEVNNHVPTP